VRTHLVRPHHVPQDVDARRRQPPSSRSGPTNPSTRGGVRRSEPRQTAAAHHRRERSNPAPIEAHQMRVEIDTNEDPPVCLGFV